VERSVFWTSCLLEKAHYFSSMKRSVQTRAVGPPFCYKHYGQPPKEPVGGYKQARLTPSNPAFAFLVQAIRDGRIKLDEPPHEIYNAHPQLYIIRPKKFL